MTTTKISNKSTTGQQNGLKEKEKLRIPFQRLVMVHTREKTVQKRYILSIYENTEIRNKKKEIQKRKKILISSSRTSDELRRK